MTFDLVRPVLPWEALDFGVQCSPLVVVDLKEEETSFVDLNPGGYDSPFVELDAEYVVPPFEALDAEETASCFVDLDVDEGSPSFFVDLDAGEDTPSEFLKGTLSAPLRKS